MRLSWTIGSVLVTGLFLSPIARGDEGGCKPVDAMIVTNFVECPSDFQSPVGLCTAGFIDSGLLKGTTLFRVLTFDQATGEYTGELVILTKHGTLTLNDTGMLTATGGF